MFFYQYILENILVNYMLLYVDDWVAIIKSILNVWLFQNTPVTYKW